MNANTLRTLACILGGGALLYGLCKLRAKQHGTGRAASRAVADRVRLKHSIRPRWRKLTVAERVRLKHGVSRG